MNYTSFIVMLFSVFLFAGCATTSSNMRVGTDRTQLNLKDQREASIAIREYASLPADSVSMGKVDASRCHRNTSQGEPSEDDVRLDLKLAAYAKGADGILDVNITKTSGLALNCWYILTGEATAISFRK